MRHPNVVATAIGYYRIRKGDSRPGETPIVKNESKRTLENSELRPYSWPAVLVFVSNWIDAEEFGKGRSYDPDKMVPRTLYEWRPSTRPSRSTLSPDSAGPGNSKPKSFYGHPLHTIHVSPKRLCLVPEKLTGGIAEAIPIDKARLKPEPPHVPLARDAVACAFLELDGGALCPCLQPKKSRYPVQHSKTRSGMIVTVQLLSDCHHRYAQKEFWEKQVIQTKIPVIV
jgi:hypothetical protein